MKTINVKHTVKGIGVDYASQADQELYQEIENKVDEIDTPELIKWNMDEFKLEHPNARVQEEILNDVQIKFQTAI